MQLKAMTDNNSHNLDFNCVNFAKENSENSELFCFFENSKENLKRQI